MPNMRFLSLVVFELCVLLWTNSGSLAAGIRPRQIKNLVTFGDSFTSVDWSANGGTPWPVYTAGYTGVQLLPFAKAGATCSNELTYRPFPPLTESQVPLFLEQKANGTFKLPPHETIYTLWIGTNDVGANALLTGSSEASLVDVTNCMVDWVEVLYENGARNFIFQNMVPLETIPLYAPNSYPNRYWTAERNTTEWSVFMRELVLSGNELTKIKLEALAPKLRGANIALFDAHSLFADMYKNPSKYLNGTAPLNVDGMVDSCVYELNAPPDATPRCTMVEGTDRDSYLWYDELHPSEQASRVVARQIADVIQGKRNRWTTWLD
ncbi:GDSL lipase/acylhydrolase [Coprinopsis cinerea okayama7|uniref:GDSL lipase/acylhydrolase n=1 Tax=Coprinopsis cinerea (strain Okayama-7 / 130 / ATCC MYA-4618 / FGSC 9003) TaxID=240176 RepID=A8NN63_COPC7|nr:GDSL lipase/acylhydrolase [Coprinopsis cinerea okayama7\|eukprot:XP_001835055.1 GDSL lipase/acylhydrolase [Coprinopsis cinerea okayama7\